MNASVTSSKVQSVKTTRVIPWAELVGMGCREGAWNGNRAWKRDRCEKIDGRTKCGKA